MNLYFGGKSLNGPHGERLVSMDNHQHDSITHEVLIMKRLVITVVVFIALIACTAPLLLAAQEDPPSSSGGGCTGPDCR